MFNPYSIGVLKYIKSGIFIMKQTYYIQLAAFFTLVLAPLSAISKVTLIKQWHLLSSQITTNIEESSTLPQARNQLDIYKKLKAFNKNNDDALILYEGCEGPIDNSFTQEFNGWNFPRLQKFLKKTSEYERILTHLGLKLEVEFGPKLENECADDMQLIKLHQLAFSDLKAFLGYLQRLEQHRGDFEKAKLYADAMLGESTVVIDPYLYALGRARSSLSQIKYYLHARNSSFLKKIIPNSKRNIAVVIGGLHIEDFKKQLKENAIEYTVYTPKGYPEKDDELLREFESILFKK